MYRIHRAVHWASLDAYIRSLGPAAWFRAGQGQTVTGSGVSQWDDISGNARHLKQGTDANRPVSLLHEGTNYLYLPGVSGNYASTPDSSAHPASSIDIRAHVTLDDWTPGTANDVASKHALGDPNRSWHFYITGYTTGLLGFTRYPTGSAASSVTSTSTSAPTVSDGGGLWVRVTFDSASGDTKFYTSTDSAATSPSSVSWAQLGNTVASAAGDIADTTSEIQIGSRATGGTTEVLGGKVSRCAIYSTIGGTTPVVDFDPSLATDQASSFVASTGETWTINSTGSKPAQIVGRSSLLFDGAAHFLKCDAFTLNQPTTVLMVVKQVGWTSNDFLYDGNALNVGALAQLNGGVSPQLVVNAGGSSSPNSNLAVGVYGVTCAVYNGAGGVFRINNTTEITGNHGSANMGGFTLGKRGDATAGNYSNIQVAEVILLPIALDATQRARAVGGLMARHGVA